MLKIEHGFSLFSPDSHNGLSPSIHKFVISCIWLMIDHKKHEHVSAIILWAPPLPYDTFKKIAYSTCDDAEWWVYEDVHGKEICHNPAGWNVWFIPPCPTKIYYLYIQLMYPQCLPFTREPAKICTWTLNWKRKKEEKKGNQVRKLTFWLWRIVQGLTWVVYTTHQARLQFQRYNEETMGWVC